MKRSLRIIMIIIVSILLIVGIGICIYNIYDSKIKNINNNDDYLYACIAKQNSNTIKTFFTTSKKDIKENDCYKYKKITCVDVDNKKYNCSKVGAKGLFSTKSFSYFTYKIENKEYIKDFLTDEFVVDPKEYDSIEWKNTNISGFIVLHIGDKQKIYDSGAKDYIHYYGYSDYKDYEAIDSYFYNNGIAVITKNKAGNIRVYTGAGIYLNDVNVDKVLYVSDSKRIFVVDGNHIKLYEYNNLLWDYGEFSNIDNIKFVTSTGNIEGNIMTYAFNDIQTEQPIYLTYDSFLKTGTISYSNHN